MFSMKFHDTHTEVWIYLAHVTLGSKYDGLQTIISVTDIFTCADFGKSCQQLSIGKLWVA